MARFSRAYGTGWLGERSPPLKRRAIIRGPCGTRLEMHK